MSVRTEYTKYENIRFDKIIRKFVAKLLKYRKLLKDILPFLILDYRDALLIILYLIVIGISNLKNRIDRMILSHKKIVIKKVKKISMFKMDVRTFW